MNWVIYKTAIYTYIFTPYPTFILFVLISLPLTFQVTRQTTLHCKHEFKFWGKKERRKVKEKGKKEKEKEISNQEIKWIYK